MKSPNVPKYTSFIFVDHVNWTHVFNICLGAIKVHICISFYMLDRLCDPGFSKCISFGNSSVLVPPAPTSSCFGGSKMLIVGGHYSLWFINLCTDIFWNKNDALFMPWSRFELWGPLSKDWDLSWQHSLSTSRTVKFWNMAFVGVVSCTWLVFSIAFKWCTIEFNAPKNKKSHYKKWGWENLYFLIPRHINVAIS